MFPKNRRSHLIVGLFVFAFACGREDASVPGDDVESEQSPLNAVANCDPMNSLITNGNFSMDLSDWTTEIHDPPSATISAITDGTTTNKVLRARNSKVQDFYKVQVWQPFDTLERNHCYRLCFRAKASAKRQIQAQVIRNAAPWDSYGLWYPKDIDTKWVKYKTEFWATATARDARLSFTFGDNTAAAYIDDVVLNDLGDIDTCAVP